MFVAIARIPAGTAAVTMAAKIAGLAAADASRLLAGTLPRVLIRATDKAPEIVANLEGAGFIAFAWDEASISTGKDRVVARSLEWTPAGLVAVDEDGRRHACPAAAIRTFIRGFRLVETTEERTLTEQHLAFAKALLTTSPLVLKKVETKGRTTSTKESFVLIDRNDGLPGIMLWEQHLGYACLGSAIQPSASGNFRTLLARLQSLAPQAALDDRITRPGFLAGLPLLALDPVDLALFLVAGARSRGC